MHAFLKPFDGFETEDFETYTPDKWSSNLHNLARMRVKQKLEALGSLLAPVLGDLGLGVVYETSSERPSIWNQKLVSAQWLYFYRDETAQRELAALLDRERSMAETVDDPAHHHSHMVLAVRVDEAGLGLLCGAHRSAWLDRRNIQQKWADPHERLKLVALLKSCTPEFEWIADAARRPCRELDLGSLDPALSRATTLNGWIAVERSFDPQAASPRAATFDEQAALVLSALAPVYRFLAWSKENDHASMRERVDEEKRARRKSRNLPFEENDEVVIVGGLFAGQRGHVQGFDGSGKVKVKVGNLTLPVRAGSLKRIA